MLLTTSWLETVAIVMILPDCSLWFEPYNSLEMHPAEMLSVLIRWLWLKL